MVSRLPGWVNFLLLVIFYCVIFYVMILFLEFVERLFGSPRAVKVILLFAGVYLAKWRFFQKPDGTFYSVFD